MDSTKWLTTGSALCGCLAVALPGASALDEYAAVVATGSVAGFLFFLLILVIAYSVSANSCVRSLMKRNGKVKMPRSYFEKKREVKRRIAIESMRSSRRTQNTYLKPTPSQSLYEAPPTPTVPPVDKATMVQGWNQESQRIYEEKGYTVELGDENEEEFHIETTLVDNEVLDVGPYKSLDTSGAKAVDGNVYSNPYLYTNNDRVTITKSSETNNGIVSSIANEMQEIPPVTSLGSTSNNVNIEDKLIRM